MRKTVDLAIELVKLILSAERLTPAGRLNAYGFGLAFVIVAGLGGLVDIVQVVVRIWNPRYSTGFPSLLAVIAVFLGLFLVCVLIVTRLQPPSGNPPESP